MEGQGKCRVFKEYNIYMHVMKWHVHCLNYTKLLSNTGQTDLSIIPLLLAMSSIRGYWSLGHQTLSTRKSLIYHQSAMQREPGEDNDHFFHLSAFIIFSSCTRRRSACLRACMTVGIHHSWTLGYHREALDIIIGHSVPNSQDTRYFLQPHPNEALF